jgi:hypothetical protein
VKAERAGAIYINSNDEMYYQDEASFSVQESETERMAFNGPTFSRLNRFVHKPAGITAEEERKRLQEHINRQKKHEIKMFLEDVNEKRGRFLN